MSDKTINLTLRVWRQKNAQTPGEFKTYQARNVPLAASFLEMLDMLNDELVEKGDDPIAFESDCREGICGTCGFVIDGRPHGPWRGTTVCQLHMRAFQDGEELTLEPWRARAFPIVKDLVVRRDAFDRIQQAGGYNSVNCGNAPDANSILIGREAASEAFDAATCIGCGACVAACKNASGMLFLSAKVGHLALLPQGEPERAPRALNMVQQHDSEGFGACTTTLDCEAACPKEISTKWIQRLNREYLRASLVSQEG